MIHELIKKSKGFLEKGLKMMKSRDRRIILTAIADECGYGSDTFIAKEFNVVLYKDKSNIRFYYRYNRRFLVKQ